jgi:hypothetical protein
MGSAAMPGFILAACLISGVLIFSLGLDPQWQNPEPG